MTKISNELIYSNEDPISENDYMIGTNGDSPAKDTKTFKFGEIRTFVNAGLAPIAGGTLAITNINYTGALTTPQDVINQLVPPKTITPYEVFVIGVNGTRYITKLQNVVVGDTKPPTVAGDYIILADGSETKISNGANTTISGNGTAATPYQINSTFTVPDATTSVKGIVQLAGDLAGTAAAPTVPGLATKQATLVSGTNIKTVNGNSLLGSGDVVISGAPDATTSVKGIVQLAGDLAGTAAAPTVPGLALKAPLASPALTGVPTAPTAAVGTNTTQLATTAFVLANSSTAGVKYLTIELAGVASSYGFNISTGLPAGSIIISATPFLRNKLASPPLNGYLVGDIVNVSGTQAADGGGLGSSGVGVRFRADTPGNIFVQTADFFDITTRYSGSTNGAIAGPTRYGNADWNNWSINIVILYV